MRGTRWLAAGMVLWLVSLCLVSPAAAQDEEGCCVYTSGLATTCVEIDAKTCTDVYSGTHTAGGTCCGTKCCPPSQSCQDGACVVPEPATIVLATVGFGAIGLWARHQRRRQGHPEDQR